MKKISLLITICASVLYINAQSIQNGSFETWYYGKPVGWTTDLHGTLTSFVNFPVSIEFGEKTSDAHSGESAVKIQSASYTVPIMGYTAKLPGILQLGEAEGFSIPAEELMNILQSLQDTTGGSFDFDNLQSLSSVAQILAKGVPCTKTPASVSMWVKYFPDGNDFMSIIALTKKDGQIVDFTYNVFDAREQYSKVMVDFKLAGTSCDSLQVIVMSSLTIDKNSVLYVDDVEIVESPLGLQQNGIDEFSLFPNPSTGIFNVKNVEGREFNWEISDMTGKVVMAGASYDDGFIDATSLTPGVYFLKFVQGNNAVTKKIVIQ